MKVKWVIYIFVLSICCTIFSCTVRNNYKTLSYFFDGVPNPIDSFKIEDPSLPISEAEFNDIRSDSLHSNLTQMTYHYPYQYKGCNDCHNKNSIGKMKIEEPDLCYQCHENFNESFKFIHGPADGGFCTSCHNPHSSKEANLLYDKINILCFNCHNIGDLSKNDLHMETSDILCTDCHNPHGADNRLMLK